MLSVTTTQRLRKRRVGSPAQLGLQSLLVASPLSAAVSLAVAFLFRHASTNHHGRIWACVIRRPTRAGGHAIGDVFVTSGERMFSTKYVFSNLRSTMTITLGWSMALFVATGLVQIYNLLDKFK